MFVSTRIPDFEQFWVSPPEYLELREISGSFAAVGAFATREVNLAAPERPLRVRAAEVDEHLLHALGARPAEGRLFAGPPTGPVC